MIQLKSGDTVDVIAPSSKVPPDVLEKVKALLASWNLHCRMPSDLLGQDLFSANTTEIRIKHLKEALTNSTSKAIWCLRGGYGATKLIPSLSDLGQLKNPKILIGSSDITALHIFLQDKYGWSTIHGPGSATVVTEKVSKESVEQLKEILFQKKTQVIKNIIPLNHFAKEEQIIKAPITGGNLSLIQTSLGTDWQIQTKNKILLIEEVNEKGYRIDRTLEHLNQAGIFNQVKAILFGDIMGGEEPEGKSYAQDAIKLFAEHSTLPIFQVNGVGHGFINTPIILGKEATLNTRNHSLEF